MASPSPPRTQHPRATGAAAPRRISGGSTRAPHALSDSRRRSASSTTSGSASYRPDASVSSRRLSDAESSGLRSPTKPAKPTPSITKPSGMEAAEAKALGKALQPLLAFAMLCEYNSKFLDADARHNLTRFHCQEPPTISLRTYMAILAQHAEFLEEGVLLGLRIAGRYCRRTKLKPSVLCAHRLLVASTVVGIKMHFDRFRSNRTVARVGALGIEELHKLEFDVFQGIGMVAVVGEQEVLNMIAGCENIKCAHELAAGKSNADGMLGSFPHAVAREAFGMTRHGQLPSCRNGSGGASVGVGSDPTASEWGTRSVVSSAGTDFDASTERLMSPVEASPDAPTSPK